MSNCEGFTATNITTARIGVLRNNWRGRLVYVHAHPTDPQKVVSIGHPLSGGGEVIVCVEDRSGFERTIGLFPQTAIYE